MRQAVKEKVTVSIDPGLIAVVDREVRTHHAASRSAVVEEALHRWSVERQRLAIERGTEAYYRLQSHAEREDDQAWARLAVRSASRLWE